MISNNVVCATSKASDQPAHTCSLVRAFPCRLNILLTEQHLEFLSLKGGCTGWSESTLVEMSHCWKSHVTAHIVFFSKKVLPVYTGPAEPSSFPNCIVLSSIVNLLVCTVTFLPVNLASM